MNITEQDKEIIRQQIGREPQGIVTVAYRAENGVPLVLQMRSIVDGKLFPTMYWLSSKTLSKAIGAIETKGWVKDVEQRLSTDEALRTKYLENQQQYIEKRAEQMLPEDLQFIKDNNFEEVFQRYGIGGIAQWDKVRCLHMQYAHHLVDGNIIGELLDEEFALNLLLQRKDIS